MSRSGKRKNAVANGTNASERMEQLGLSTGDLFAAVERTARARRLSLVVSWAPAQQAKRQITGPLWRGQSVSCSTERQSIIA